MQIAKPPSTLLEAVRYFADEDRCLAFMVGLRWPDAILCPTCGSKEVSFLSSRKLWKCKSRHARQQFSIKVGTIFEDSPIPLSKWLPTMWLIANCKNGVSSYEVHRALGVTQKTAWFMLHRIRLAMQTNTFEKLGGTVEIDETWIGGNARKMNRRQREKTATGQKPSPHAFSGKAVVLGMLERGGQVVTKVMRDVRRGTLMPEIRKHVNQGTEIHTDSMKSYDSLDLHPDHGGISECTHHVVDHAVEYARGNVHVNGIENFWSLLKRAIRGTYVSVEPFHLFRYLDEQSFRFNNRKMEDGDGGRFERVLDSIIGRRLTYKGLIGYDQALATT